MPNQNNDLFSKLTDKDALALITKVESFFKGFPHLPKSISDFLVKITPWGVGLGGFMSLMGGISNLRHGLGFGVVSRFINLYVGVSPIYFLILAVIQFLLAVLAFKAFNYLRETKLTGWIYIFWSNILSLVEYLLTLIFMGGSTLGFLLGAVLGFYFLFEIKPSYTGKQVTKEKRAVKEKQTVKKKKVSKKS